MQNNIYLDNAATTKCDEAVVDVMLPYLNKKYGNSSSQHNFGREAKIAIEKSREQIGNILNAEPYEIIFTSGGTEAINFGIIGAAFLQKRNYNKNEIIASKIEHHAVLNTLDYLKLHGFKIIISDVNNDGIANANEMQKSISKNTALVCLMHANNEIGTIQPVEEIGELVKNQNLLFFSDTIQTIGKLKFNFNNYPSHMATISAHKINGPKGIGILLLKKGVEIDSLIHGGGQERNRRAGTENVASIVGLAKALEIWEINRNTYENNFKNLKNILIDELKKSDKIIFNCNMQNSLLNILSVSIDTQKINMDGEMLLINMDLNGISVSSGSACSSGSIQPSHVLSAMGRDLKTTKSTIRFSFDKETTDDEVLKAGKVLLEIIKS